MTPMLTERQEIERIAQEYRDRGYVVIVQPRDDEIPEFLRNTHPDIVAFSKDEKVLVEVKQTSQLRQSQELTEFAKRVEAHPGWRFELVTIAPLESDSDSTTYLMRWKTTDIQARLKEARLAAKAGYYQAALLLAYAATEAGVFVWAESASTKESSVTKTFRTARAVVRQMVIEGAIGQEEFALFQRMEELRNSLAHGVASREALPGDVDALIEFATTVMEASGDASI